MGRWEEFPLQTSTALVLFPLPVAVHSSIKFMKSYMLKSFKISEVLHDVQISVGFLPFMCLFASTVLCGKPCVSSSLIIEGKYPFPSFQCPEMYLVNIRFYQHLR